MDGPEGQAERVLTNCIYCDGRRGDPDFSDEHIWPQALGGDACPPVFRTKQVCGRCNNLAGQWVDRAFLRNFFTSNERARTAYDYIDPNKPGQLPLIFMGIDEEFPTPEHEVCERWLGPSGESIYHIHMKDDDRWTTLAGGDFIKRKRDPGRLYFTLTSKSDYWFYTAIISIVRYFPGTSPVCTAEIPGLPVSFPVRGADAEMMTELEKTELAWIRSRRGMHKHRLVADIGYADRFLAKIALGLGFNILGPRAVFSEYGDELRKMLWCSDFS